MNRPLRALALAFVVLGAGCASVPRDPAARAEYRANHDPLEPLNRRIFAFNLFVDRILLKPLAKGYRAVLPAPARDALRRFLDNLGEPVVLGNDLLQARWRGAAITTGRFVANSTLGVAGFADWAKRHHLPRQTGDFGQTLDRWGFGEGPYLVLPVVGPSNPRDAIGSGVDVYIDPFRYVVQANEWPTALTSGRQVIGGIDERSRHLEELDALQRESIDYYAAFRSLYRQNRAAELHPGRPPPTPEPDSFYDDPAAATAPPARR